MNVDTLRRPALLSWPRVRVGAALGAGAGDTELPATLDPRRAMPVAAAVLAAGTIPLVALTAAGEVGAGFAYRDVIGLLAGHALATAVLARLRWARWPASWVATLVALQLLFVVSLTTMTGGGSSPYFALYAPVLALAGWHLRTAMVVAAVGLVGLTESWRAIVVGRDGSLDQLTIALPLFAVLALLAHLTARRLTGAVVTIRRDQARTAATLAAVRALGADPSGDPIIEAAAATRAVFGASARTVSFDPPTMTADPLLGTTEGGREISVAIAGTRATHGLLVAERERPFSATEVRLLGILAGAAGRAVDTRHLFDELRSASERDPLTGLLNRRAFETDLEVAIPEMAAAGRSITISFVDLDRTKELNDRYGHDAGDRAIRGAARGLTAATREGDRVYRVGGDEFVVVAAGLDVAGARRLGERLAAVRGAPVERRRAAGAIAPDDWSVSVGVAHADNAAGRIDSLIERADRSMYEAKSDGGGRVHVAG